MVHTLAVIRDMPQSVAQSVVGAQLVGVRAAAAVDLARLPLELRPEPLGNEPLRRVDKVAQLLRRDASQLVRPVVVPPGVRVDVVGNPLVLASDDLDTMGVLTLRVARQTEVPPPDLGRAVIARVRLAPLLPAVGSSDGRSAPHATAVWAGSICQELARPVLARISQMDGRSAGAVC
jgi:hypothetical protein